MGFLTRVIKNSAYSSSDEYSMEDFDRDAREKMGIGGRVSATGVNVNEEKALKYITVYSCARVLAEDVAHPPLFVYKERRSGGKDKAKDHRLYEVLHDEPNDEMTSMTWRETQIGHLVLSGNCYSLITHNRRGQVIDLYPVPWADIEPVRNERTRKLEYRLTDRGKQEILPPEKVFHIPGLGYDGIKGYSPVRMGAEAIALGLAATEFVSRFYGQGMNIGTIIEHPEVMEQDSRTALKEDLMDRGAGLANSWMPIILDGGAKIERIPMPLKEAQFVELMNLTKADICGFFRMQPHMIGILDRATHSNIEQQSLEHVKYTLMPWFIRWEQAINRRLFTSAERREGYYVKFNVDGLLRGDYKSRMEGLHIQRQDGIINADEWREKEEMNPQEGGTGKVYLINGNMVSVETAAKQQPRNTGGGQSD